MFRGTFAALVSILMLTSASAIAAPVDPPTVTATLDPGQSLTVTKTVHTPAIAPRPDILFLADTTGSMGPAIANVRTNAGSIMATVSGSPGVGEARFGAAEYKDGEPAFCPSDPFAYRLNQAVTTNTANVQTGINMWSASGGCPSESESGLNALFRIATDAATMFRPLGDSTRIIAWFGDSDSHDPSFGHSLAAVISALNAAQIRVIAVAVVTPVASNGLDVTGQATAITTATGGTLLTAATSDDVSTAILNGLTNLPVTVTHSLSGCDPDLTVALSPASQTVTSGSDATFTETITAALGAPQGTTLTCTVNFLLNGQPASGFTESITIAVNDVTRPRASCEETNNPSGRNVPTAGANPKSGQNPDGYYVLSATDNVTADPQIFVRDSDSSFVAGPYPSGTKIKLVQAPGATPSVKAGSGDIDFKITLNGDAIVTAVDGSGNVSAAATCNVPPPPK